MALELFHVGSVKDFYRDTDNLPTDTRFGVGRLQFREGPKDGEGPYSIFDYGDMPYGIPNKHEQLYNETVHFFKLLEKNGIPHHMIEDLGNNNIKVRLARIPPNYKWIKRGETSIYLIPLEVIFSTTITPVASLHKDLIECKEKPEDYGLDAIPGRYDAFKLPNPKVRFSTKIETTDKYKKGLARKAGLIGNEEKRIKELALTVNDIIREDSAQVDLDTADGKIEVVMGPARNMFVGDTCYTWDECRELYWLGDGRYVDLSKQLPRNVYTIVGWRDELKAAQKKHPEDKRKWPAPPEIGDETKQLFADASEAVYRAILRKTGGPGLLRNVAVRALDTLDRLKEKYKRDEVGNPL